jgi:GT2 family glycosyltransferase
MTKHEQVDDFAVRHSLAGEISVISVTWNSAATIGPVLEALPRQAEVIVVDNASSDSTTEVVSRRDTRLIEPGENLGFGRACNLGARLATRPILVFLNPDAVPAPFSLERLAWRLTDDHVGAVLPALSSSIGQVRDTVGHFPSPTFELAQSVGLWKLAKAARIRSGRVVPIQWGFAACLAMRRGVFEEIGGFDPAIFLYGEDMDICHRVGCTGRQVVLDTTVVVDHIGNVSGEQAFAPIEQARLKLAADIRWLCKYHSRTYARATLAMRKMLIALRRKPAARAMHAAVVEYSAIAKRP